MGIVQTVTGPVDATDLGVVLSHEHVQLNTLGLRENYPDATIPRHELVEICVATLTRLKRSGVDTLVDHTTFEVGRDMDLLREASERSGLKIVASTGIIVQIPRWFHKHAIDDIAALFIKELRAGVADTGLRTGIIKCALDKGGLPDPTERVLRACARAHVATGIPISTHSWAGGYTGDTLQSLFREEGVDLTKVIIGHCGDTEDLDYLYRLMAAGSYLGMDRFGCEDYLPDAQRIAVVVRLCAEGHADRLLLSHDTNCWSDRDINLPEDKLRANWNYFHLHETIVPAMRAGGVTGEQIGLMTGGNFARLFAS